MLDGEFFEGKGFGVLVPHLQNFMHAPRSTPPPGQKNNGVISLTVKRCQTSGVTLERGHRKKAAAPNLAVLSTVGRAEAPVKVGAHKARQLRTHSLTPTQH